MDILTIESTFKFSPKTVESLAGIKEYLTLLIHEDGAGALAGKDLESLIGVVKACADGVRECESALRPGMLKQDISHCMGTC